MADSARKPGNAEAAEERREKAFSLRKAGASYRAIGRQLEISEAQAFRDVKRVLQRIRRRTDLGAEEHVALELERLDQALLAIGPQVQKGHLGAVESWRKLSESRRKLLGLDAASGADRDLNERISALMETLAEKRTRAAPAAAGE